MRSGNSSRTSMGTDDLARRTPNVQPFGTFMSHDSQELDSYRPRRRRRWTYVLIASLGVAGIAFASDHQDTPEVELSPRMDINDVYAFPGSTAERIALVLTTSSPITPAQSAAAGFDQNLLYQLKVDNTGDGVEDKVFQITFAGTGNTQQMTVRG